MVDRHEGDDRGLPGVREVLAAAVEQLGGEERPGQIAMAEAVARGDGATSATCSSRPAPAPASRSATSCPRCCTSDRVVVATATLALQHQLVERDIPALLEAAGDELEGGGTFAVLKGRSNYACLHRVREGVPDDQGALVELPEGSLGAEVVALREWIEEEAAGRRHRRARPRAAAHRPRLAAGQRQPPRVPRREQVPLRHRVLRRARQGARLPLAADRHQPLAARDRRDRGRPDDPGVRRGGDRRGPRARLAGDPGRHRRALRRRRSTAPPAAPSATSRAPRPTTSPTPARCCATPSTTAGPAASTSSRRSSPTRSRWCATPPVPWSRPSRATPATTPAPPRPRAGPRSCSPSPGGWRPARTRTCSG